MSAQQINHNYRNNYFSQEVVDLLGTVHSVWNTDSLFCAIAVSYLIFGQLHTFFFQTRKLKVHDYVIVYVKGALTTEWHEIRKDAFLCLFNFKITFVFRV